MTEKDLGKSKELIVKHLRDAKKGSFEALYNLGELFM